MIKAKVTDLGFPITIEAHQILDCRFHDLIPVPNCPQITLNDQESRLFRRFMSMLNRRSFWVEEVGELQCLYDIDGVDYLVSTLPLAGLKFILSPSPDDLSRFPKATQELIGVLKEKIKPWKDFGADMVTIDGVDLRKSTCPKGEKNGTI